MTRTEGAQAQLQPVADHAEAPLRIALADDHALVRGRLALMMRVIDSSAQIYEAGDFDALCEILDKGRSDLLLLDLMMPGVGDTEGVEKLCARYADLPVVVVSMKDDVRTICSALRAGPMGYVPKTLQPSVTLNALRLVLSGGVYIPPHALGLMIDTPESDPAPNPPGDEELQDDPALTKRQREIMELVARGLSNKAIAEELGLAAGTVKMHTSRIFRQLGVENRTMAVARLSKRSSTS